MPKDWRAKRCTKAVPAAFREQRGGELIPSWWEYANRETGRGYCHSLSFALPPPATLLELIGFALGVRYVSGLQRCLESRS
jgi:hypothetical protein